MAPHSSTLAWQIPWTEESGSLQSMGSLRVRHGWVTSLSLSRIGEGNGNPLQGSRLENPRDGGAWWSAIHRVAQSWTQLTWLSSSSNSAWKFVFLALPSILSLKNSWCSSSHLSQEVTLRWKPWKDRRSLALRWFCKATGPALPHLPLVFFYMRK